jgi:hypothetical protein
MRSGLWFRHRVIESRATSLLATVAISCVCFSTPEYLYLLFETFAEKNLDCVSGDEIRTHMLGEWVLICLPDVDNGCFADEK